MKTMFLLMWTLATTLAGFDVEAQTQAIADVTVINPRTPWSRIRRWSWNEGAFAASNRAR
jgi:hypothetical protein